VQLNSLEKALTKRLASKLKRDPALKTLNIEALRLGWEALHQQIPV
jgi:hypothetical protein